MGILRLAPSSPARFGGVVTSLISCTYKVRATGFEPATSCSRNSTPSRCAFLVLFRRPQAEVPNKSPALTEATDMALHASLRELELTPAVRARPDERLPAVPHPVEERHLLQPAGGRAHLHRLRLQRGAR